MKKKTQTASPVEQTPGVRVLGKLADERALVSQVTPEALERFLHRARLECHSIEFRIKVATEAKDNERVELLKKELAAPAKKRDYFTDELQRRFPDHKIAETNLRRVEDQVIVADYLSVKSMERDAKITADAAKALGLDVERQVALKDMAKAMRYLVILEPRFKRLEKRETTRGK